MGRETPGILIANGPDTVFQGGAILRSFPQPEGEGQNHKPPPALEIPGLESRPVSPILIKPVKAERQGRYLPFPVFPGFPDDKIPVRSQ
jgi:hypothetical protein